MGHALSGSIVKGWFQYRCERKVRYETMSGPELSAVPVLADDRENPWAVKGIDFEDQVVSKLAGEERVLVSKGTKKSGSRLVDGLAIPFLTGKGDGRYAAQLNVAPKTLPKFVQHLRDTRIASNLPDLIRRTGDANPMFAIIDIKATRRATAFHKAQVAWYALLLETKLQELGVHPNISSVGEIWRFPDTGPLDGQTWGVERFDLDPYKRQVIAFCEHNLPEILGSKVTKQEDETFFHIYFKCEQCKFLPHCLQAIEPNIPASQLDTSAVAGMSHQGKKTLADKHVGNVAALASESEDVAADSSAGWRLTRSIGTLIARARSLRDDKILPGPDQQTYLMPPRTNVALYLSADFDAIDGSLAALGYHYVDPQGERSAIQVIAESSTKAEGDALVDVFTRVIADLAAVDRHNKAVQRGGTGTAMQAHIFVYEPSEAVYLQDAVKRHLNDQRVRDGLLNMVRLFPPDEVIPEPEFRGIDHLPATALRSVVEQLYALPVHVSHDLRQVSSAVARLGEGANPYTPVEPFLRPFSAMLAMDVIRNLREQRPKAVTVDEIRADVLARLRASRGVAEWLFTEHERKRQAGGPLMLRLKKKPFRLQASFDPLNVSDLDVLTALELLENRSDKLETLINLSRPKETRARTGRAIGPLKFLSEEDGGTTWIVEAVEDLLDTDLSSDAFGLILTDGAPESVLEPSLWDAYTCSIKGIYGRRIYLKVPPPMARSQARRDLERKMSVAGNSNWWIDQGFKDLNTSRVQDFLRTLGGVSA